MPEADWHNEGCRYVCDSSKLDSVHRAVFGNGEPEKSLLARVSMIEKDLGEIHKLAQATFRWVLGVMAGIALLFVGAVIQLLKH